MEGSDSYALEGLVSDRRGMRPGYLIVEDGRAAEVGGGECPVRPDRRGIVLMDTVNGHTHCADYGLRVPPGMSLQELVAPPDGLKHRYLREAPEEEIASSMRRFSADSSASGAVTFVDFREGGAEGCRLLRCSAPEAVILGRPVSPEFDPNEVDDILKVADGIGISSISDMDHGYVEAVADAVRERRGIFAVHVSERVREDIDFVLSLDPAFVVHMCEATDSDLLKCAEAEVPVVVCPTSNRYFGKVPPIARAEAMGVDLAIGTDNGMIRSPDILDEAAEFARVAEAQGGDPGCVWSALWKLSGKILNQHSNIQKVSEAGVLSVLPTVEPVPSVALSGGRETVRFDKETKRL